MLCLLCVALLQLLAAGHCFAPLAYPPTMGTRPHDTTTKLHVANDADTFAFSIAKRASREEAYKVMDESILPLSRYSDRQRSGRDAQGLQGGKAIAATDPCMEFTYGEFPLASLDQLLDVGITYLPNPGSKDPITMVDLGSGCGRLVFYAALTRGTEEVSWTVHGIEVADLLHDEALRASLNGIDSGWFQDNPNENSNANNVLLHKGLAGDFSSVLQQCDIVFAYSTVWNSIGFSEKLGAMIIGQEWNDLISKSCRKGTVGSLNV